MRISHSRILLMLVTLLLGVLTVSGCARTIGVAKGWSGGTVADDDTLFIGSMEGKLVALNATDGSRLGNPVALETELPTGGFGCLPEACAGPASRAVAIYGSPVVGTTLVYLGGYDGKVYAFQFEDNRLRNEPRWIYPRQGSVGGAVVGGLVIAYDKIYFGAANGKVYALDAADGFLEWMFETGDRIWSAPAIDGDTLFVGSFDRKLYALNASDGTKKWDFETEAAIMATPAVYGNTVYVGSFDRHLYAVDVTSGEQVWQFPTADEEGPQPSSWFWVKPLVYDDVVYAGCLDGKVYVLNAGSGSTIRQYDLESPIISSPVLVDNLIIFATEAGTVYSIDTTNNRQQLLVSLDEQVYAPLFANEGTVYVHTIADSLYAIDIKSGESKKFTLVTE